MSAYICGNCMFAENHRNSSLVSACHGKRIYWEPLYEYQDDMQAKDFTPICSGCWAVCTPVKKKSWAEIRLLERQSIKEEIDG